LAFFILTGITAPPPQNSNTISKTNPDEIAAVESNQTELKKAPVITTDTVTETEAVPFESKTVESASVNKGTTTITTQGVNGVKTRTFTVTYEDGKESKRELTNEEITRQPIAQVTTVGTKVAAAPKPKPVAQTNCDSNYSGACVPIASDVDCAGGSGNGPAYVSGPVTVVGSDIYGLDRDGNGVGCE